MTSIPKDLIHKSKFLSLILRHEPQRIGLSLDMNGWASVPQLLEKACNGGMELDFDTLVYIVHTHGKKRFAFNEDFSKIRAVQGHSLEVDLGYSPSMPPTVLYHGTAQHNISEILSLGIERRSRLYVHLSQEQATAQKVGSRHGKPIVLEIQALQMHQDGFKFYRADNGVWLTKEVPVHYIKP